MQVPEFLSMMEQQLLDKGQNQPGTVVRMFYLK